MPVENERPAEIATFMNHKDSLHDGVTTQSGSQSDRTVAARYCSTARKEKPASIFSFLQRFRVRNRNIFEDVASLPSSPRSIRRPQKPRSRWESAESILSTATAASFAFIPPSQVRGGPRLLHPTAVVSERTNFAYEPPSAPIPSSSRDNTVFLRRKYNLLGSDASLCPNERKRSLKNLYRNSVGNVENIRIDGGASYNDISFSSFRRPAKPIGGLSQRPKSEYNISRESDSSRRIYCHRPGKGRAPPPPVSGEHHAKILTKSTCRKKRKAPAPPENTNTVVKMEVVKTDVADSTRATEATADEDAEKQHAEPEIVVCNDSLKLEKGQLKANNRSLTISSTNSSISSDPSIPVSPKPWYKRSSVRGSKKSSSRKKTPEQLLDDWILEAGLPRSSSFCGNRQVVGSPQTSEPVGNKRRSQISILTNISELDREAAEIVQKERRKEHEMAASIDDRFYDPAPFCSRGASLNKYVSAKEANASTKRHTSKDLISIINAVTNVTKISVNANFFKDASIIKQIRKPEQTDRSTSHKLTITELNDLDKGKETSSSGQGAARPKENVVECNLVMEASRDTTIHPTKDTLKPVKQPFSSWVCPQCTLENPSWKFICEACNKWRPYSVNKIAGRPAALVTPKEDLKLPLHQKLDQASALYERNQIKQISASIRKQVYDILTSGENVRNNLNRLKGSSEAGKLMKSESETNVPLGRSENDLEETRRARLAFFSKNCLNDLNRDERVAKPTSPEKGSTQNKYYNEEDRRKLREILKELKESLPKNNLPDRNKQKSETSGVASVKTEGDKVVKRKENFKSSKSADKSEPLARTQVSSVPEPMYSIIVKKCNQKEEVSKAGPRCEKIPKIESAKSLPEEGITMKKILPADGPTDVNSRRTDEKQLQDLKGNVAGSRENKSTVNLTVNRLLQKLQTAIASGQHHEAANIARDLARLKVNCNMTRQGTPDHTLDLLPKCANVGVNIHIRRDSTQLAPVHLNLNSNSSLNELKNKVFEEYDVLPEKQVWMVRGKLVEDESVSLEQLGANETNVFDLYVYSSSDKGSSSNTENVPDRKSVRQQNSTSTNPNDDTRYPSYVLMNPKNTTMIYESSLTSAPSKQKYNDLGSSESKIPSNHPNKLKSPDIVIKTREDELSKSETKEKVPIIDTTNFLPQAGDQLPTTNVENHFNKLKNAQIVSKIEESIKIRNKTALVSPSTSKDETDKTVNSTDKNEVKSASEFPVAAKDDEKVIHKLENVRETEAKEPPNSPPQIMSRWVTGSIIENDAVVAAAPDKKQNKNLVESKTLADESNPMGVPKSLQNELNYNRDDEWKCVRCTLINSKKEENCTICALPKSQNNVNESQRSLSVVVDDDRNAEIDRLANYKELIDMEKSDIIPNVEKFECSICLVEYDPGEGVVLKECLHTFCKTCLAQTVQHSAEAEVKCPFRDDQYYCESVLQEREIKALVTSEVYEQHLARSVKEAENKIQNTFHCKTPNCHGWCIFEDNVNEFLCPVCDKMNCLTCQVIHTGLNCKQYQEIINQESETNADANRTRLMLLEMLEKKEAMTCPTCQVILMKKWGCDWLRCSMCKTEICWVTRGFRWGPKGKGDTSGGCRCGVKGIKCHPRCSYCH